MKEYILPVLRGISQIFFINNPWCGLIIVLAATWAHPLLAVCMLLGSGVQTWLAQLLGWKEQAREGLMGYNGALVGAAAGFQLQSFRDALFFSLLGACACLPVHRFYEKLFLSPLLAPLKLPVLTAPFCTVAGLLTLLISSLSHPGQASSSSKILEGSLLGIFNGFSEVILADGLITGILIFIGLFIGSWKVALYGLFGNILSLLCVGLLMGVENVSSGLYGYSALLAAAGLGAVFWNEKTQIKRFLGAGIASLLTLPIYTALAYTEIPVFTWPFVLALWIVMGLEYLLTVKNKG